MVGRLGVLTSTGYVDRGLTWVNNDNAKRSHMKQRSTGGYQLCLAFLVILFKSQSNDLYTSLYLRPKGG